MLHAGVAPAFAHGVVEEIMRHGRAERFDMAQTETLDGFGCELELGDRHEVEGAKLVGGALTLRIEAADRLQRVAEEIEPYRLGHARCEKIDDAAAHRILAGLAHGRRAREAVELQPAADSAHGEHMARRNRERLPGDEISRRHALKHGIYGGEKDGRAVMALDTRQPRQRGHALRHENRVGRDPVVGQTIPGRKLLHREIGSKEAERAGECGHARSVAAHDSDADGRRIGSCRHGAGEIGHDEPFGAIGHACQRERRPATRSSAGLRVMLTRPHLG